MAKSKTPRLHHAQVKAFTKLGVTPILNDNGTVTVDHNGEPLTGSAQAVLATLQGRKIKHAAKPTQQKGNVIKPKYRPGYKVNNGCGDNIQRELAAEFVVDNPETGKPQLLLKEFRAWAVKYGLWDAKYESLNPGMCRMNVGNKVRARIRNGEEIKVRNTVLTID